MAEGQVDNDVRRPCEGRNEPKWGKKAGRRNNEQRQRWRRVMHRVEERHGSGRHLPAGMRLADTKQGREVGNDPEDQEHAQS